MRRELFVGEQTPKTVHPLGQGLGTYIDILQLCLAHLPSDPNQRADDSFLCPVVSADPGYLHVLPCPVTWYGEQQIFTLKDQEGKNQRPMKSISQATWVCHL